MTKKGYTHILIPTSFHSVLKERAQKRKLSIWRYLEELVEGDIFIEEFDSKPITYYENEIEKSLASMKELYMLIKEIKPTK